MSPVFETEVKLDNKIHIIRIATPKRLSVAFAWWLFGGIVGAHRFYLGQPLIGWLYVWTLGLFGIGWFIDGLNLSDYVRNYNRHRNLT